MNLIDSFSKKKYKLPINNFKECSMLFAIREIQIITLSFYLTELRMAVIKKTNDSKFFGERVERGTSFVDDSSADL